MNSGLVLRSRWFVFALSVAAGTLLSALLFASPVWLYLTHLSYDVQTASRLDGNGPGDVVLVLLDRRSHEELDQSGAEPWDTALYADLLDKLFSDGAALVVFDVYFAPENELPGDVRFREAGGRGDPATSVVFAAVAEVTFPASAADVPFGAIQPTGIAIKPPRFADASHSNWGLVNLWGTAVDRDFAVRRVPGVVPPESKLEPILGVRRMEQVAAERWKEAQGRIGSGCAPPPGAWIRYRTNPGAFSTVSFVDAWRGAAPDGTFRDKVVFVGGSQVIGFSGASKDVYAAPFAAQDGAPGMLGVELNVHLFEGFRHCDWLRLVPGWKQMAAAFGTAGLLALLFAVLPVRLVAPAAVIVMVAGYFLAPLFADRLGIVCNWMILPLALVPATSGAAGTLKLFSELRQKRRFQREFERYVPPAVARDIARGRKLEPHLRVATVLMTDLASFTTLADEMNPAELIDILHKYFNDVVQVIFSQGGTVVSYIGDAVLAVWGVPIPGENESSRAVAAAAEIIERTFQKKYYGHHLKTRIGITRGKVLAGNIGSDDSINYAITGDCVNLSSRLEGLSKHLGTTVLFSESVHATLNSAVVTDRFVGNFILAGKGRAIPVHQLFTVRDAKIAEADLTFFNEGLAHFTHGEGERALRCFEKAQAGGADPVAAFYASWIAREGAAACSADGIAVSK